jgi:PAS domain S-box-containing protein
VNRLDGKTEATTPQPPGSTGTFATQASATAAPSSSHIIARLIVGVAVVILLVAAMAAAALYHSRDLYRDRALTATQNLAQLIERDFTAALDKVDLALMSVKDEAESQLAGGHLDAKRLSALIVAQHAHQSGFDGLRVAGLDGTVVAGVPATNAPPANIEDREYFARAREDEAGLVISRPVVGRDSGRWTIVAARRINHPDGSFAGVVLASIFIEQFEKALSVLDLGSYGAATLRNQDLQLIARYSRQASAPSPVGNSTVSRELAEAVLANPESGTYLAATSLDRIERANAYRKMAKYPFYVLVGLATDDYLSIWRAEAVKTSALVTTFALVTALLTGLIASAWRRREADANRILELSRTALRRSEHRLQHALESAEMGVWSLDPETDDFEADAQARLLHGLLPHGPVTRDSALSSIPAEDRHRAAAARDDAMRSGSPYDLETRVLRPDGTLRWIHLSGRREPGSDGRAGRLVGLVQDITERKQAEEALQRRGAELESARSSAESAKAEAEKASQAKDQFLAVLSHELRTPLTPVLAAVQLLQRRTTVSESAREPLEVIRRNVQLQARLIDDLLDLTRIARGKLELRRKRIDMCTVIERAVETAKPDIDARRLHFGVDTKGAPYWVEGDPSRLQQVVWNLLTNAVKFTPEGGCVGVHCERTAGQVVIEVSDSGIGIEADAAERIFDAFEQGGRAITRQFGGLGLGLAIARQLVQMHEGTISVHSDGRNRGATFRVSFPLASAPLEENEQEHTASADGRSRRILLVEDNGDSAWTMKMLLETFGYHVETAGDVRQALEAIESTSFELLISDLGLPDGSGIELMQELRRRGHALKGIAVSGYGQDEDTRRSKEVGFSAHLVKPVDVDVLMESVAAVIRTAS